jgi:cytochrome c-type biogenesis protein CcmH/NrfG
MSRRNRSTANSRGFAIVAIGIIVFLLAGSVLLLIPIGGGGDDEDDDVIRVTPGAEVSRLETVIAQNPDDIDSMVVLAEVLANSGRINESIPWFEQAIEARPEDPTLRIAFGRALQRANSDFDAELQLKRAVEIDPASSEAAFYLALFYESREPPRTDEARNWYQRAIDAAPDSVIAGQAQERLAALDPTASPVATP